MKKFFKWLGIVILGLILLVVVLVGGFVGLRSMNFIITDEVMMDRFTAPSHTPISFESLKLKASPNQFLVCDPDLCDAEPHRQNQAYDLPADELRSRVEAIITRSPRVTHVNTDDALQQLDYIQRTPMMQYPDLITIRIAPLTDGTSTLYVYSRSVYGYGDGGVNQARIEAWLDELEAL